MLSFLEYKNWNVLEEAVERNTHSTHLEDLCITNKKKGVAQALGGLLYVKKQFGTASSNKSTAVTIKVDGCVSGDTLVITNDGVKPISGLTNEDYVKCLDTDTGKIHYCNNTLPRHSDSNKNWIQLEFSNGSTLTCTEDHPILDSDMQYQEAKDLLGKTIYNL